MFHIFLFRKLWRRHEIKSDSFADFLIAGARLIEKSAKIIVPKALITSPPDMNTHTERADPHECRHGISAPHNQHEKKRKAKRSYRQQDH